MGCCCTSRRRSLLSGFAARRSSDRGGRPGSDAGHPRYCRRRRGARYHDLGRSFPAGSKPSIVWKSVPVWPAPSSRRISAKARWSSRVTSLVTIDPAPYEAAVAQAQAEAGAASAKLDLAKVEVDRGQKLSDNKTISQTTWIRAPAIAVRGRRQPEGGASCPADGTAGTSTIRRSALRSSRPRPVRLRSPWAPCRGWFLLARVDDGRGTCRSDLRQLQRQRAGCHRRARPAADRRRRGAAG